MWSAKPKTMIMLTDCACPSFYILQSISESCPFSTGSHLNIFQVPANTWCHFGQLHMWQLRRHICNRWFCLHNHRPLTESWIDTYRFSILHVRRGGTTRNFTSRNDFTVGTLWGFTRSVEFDFPSPEKFDLFVEEKRTPTMYGLVFAQGENSP